MQKPSLNLEKQAIAAEEYSPAYVCNWGPLNEHWGSQDIIKNIWYFLLTLIMFSDSCLWDQEKRLSRCNKIYWKNYFYAIHSLFQEKNTPSKLFHNDKYKKCKNKYKINLLAKCGNNTHLCISILSTHIDLHNILPNDKTLIKVIKPLGHWAISRYSWNCEHSHSALNLFSPQIKGYKMHHWTCTNGLLLENVHDGCTKCVSYFF